MFSLGSEPLQESAPYSLSYFSTWDIWKGLLQVQTVQPSRAQQSVITLFHGPHHFALSAAVHNSSAQLSRSESNGRSVLERTQPFLCEC